MNFSITYFAYIKLSGIRAERNAAPSAEITQGHLSPKSSPFQTPNFYSTKIL